MASTTFKKNIEQINFSFKKKGEGGGVILTKDFENQTYLSPQEVFALEVARDKFEADAVYFRYFEDNRESTPQIFIYDNTSNRLTDEKKKDIHKKVWSGCIVPIFIIVDKTEVKIFDAREEVDDRENRAFEIIQLTGSAIRDFTAKSFDTGLFWEEKDYQLQFQYSTSAYQNLITGLKNVYLDFQKTSNLNSHVALKLVVQCLLIKYIEERDEQSDSGYFSKTYFKRYFGCNNFCDVIRSGKLLDLLDQLSSDFNGRIFEWNIEEEKEERRAISQSNVTKLAFYLDGTVDNNQFVLWRLYSFSHLPVELISSVYEELLTNSKDIVYTPEMVVSTLIDECMPLKTPQKDFKLIDVSCGSGIFLVKAYKRIIQWWRLKKWQETGKLEKPGLTTLKQLLVNSIYGVDIQGDAIKLSVFSLSLAMLDEVDLSPPVWQKLKFPDLSEKNIIEQDFFQLVSSKHARDFDLVIGNPPFNPPLNEEGEKVGNGDYFRMIKAQYGYESQVKIPDDNPALHFLIKALELLKDNALLCMIQPAGPFLYQKDQTFKNFLLRQYNLLQVIDLTKLSDVLWGRKNVATVATFFQKSFPDSEPILHVIANRTNSNLKKLFLEFDYYDFHLISKDSAVNNSFCWKANLFGGGRLETFIYRLSQLPTFGEYLETKTKAETNKWVVGDGFIKGKPDEKLKAADFEKKKGGYYEAPFLTGSECFEPEDFDENGIHRTYTLTDRYYQWKRQPEIFKGPLLLIKKNIGIESIPVIYIDKDISYKNEIIGVHAPKSEASKLQYLEKVLRSNQIFRFYLLLTSSRAGVSRSTSTLLQKDILNLPFAEGVIKLSKSEKILLEDVMRFYLKPSNDRLDKHVSEHTIGMYTSVFCQTLNSIYQTDEKSFSLYKIIIAGKYILLHFEYTSSDFSTITEVVDNLEEYIVQHLPQRSVNGNEGVHVQKILKVYGKDTILLAKPNRLRYWLRSIALRDADECFADYVNAGF